MKSLKIKLKSISLSCNLKHVHRAKISIVVNLVKIKRLTIVGERIMNSVLSKLSEGLIVSCQALQDEPLHSSYIMSKMAKAASEGGAVAIRANSYEDIIEIKKEVDLPIIGIVKRDYEDSEVYITPTVKEVKELLAANVDIIAMDATSSKRPNSTTLQQLLSEVKQLDENVLLMADCSTFEEIKNAVNLGFDIISTTLVGYTKQSDGIDLAANNYQLLKEMIDYTHDNGCFFIAEGNIDTQEKIENAITLGADSIVVGSMITRPQLITKKYCDYVAKAKGKLC